MNWNDGVNYKCSDIFLFASVIDIFDCIIVREHTRYDFKSIKFVEVCFMAQEIAYSGEQCMGN